MTPPSNLGENKGLASIALGGGSVFPSCHPSTNHQLVKITSQGWSFDGHPNGHPHISLSHSLS